MRATYRSLELSHCSLIVPIRRWRLGRVERLASSREHTVKIAGEITDREELGGGSGGHFTEQVGKSGDA